jgi:DNA-binding GntR family transcriptional regulator
VSGNFAQWVDTASGKSLPVEQKILDISVIRPAPARVAPLLDVAPGAPLWTMRRVRWISGHVVSYHLNYGLPHRLGRIDERKMAGNRNFVDVLRQDLGIKLHRMDQLVEATVADRDLADLLDAQFGDPVFFVENVYSDVHDTAAAVTHLYLRGDHYAYQTSMTVADWIGTDGQLQ